MDTANETRRTTVRLPLSLVSRLFSTRYLYSRRGGREKKDLPYHRRQRLSREPILPFFSPPLVSRNREPLKTCHAHLNTRISLLPLFSPLLLLLLLFDLSPVTILSQSYEGILYPGPRISNVSLLTLSLFLSNERRNNKRAATAFGVKKLMGTCKVN